VDIYDGKVSPLDGAGDSKPTYRTGTVGVVWRMRYQRIAANAMPMIIIFIDPSITTSNILHNTNYQSERLLGLGFFHNTAIDKHSSASDHNITIPVLAYTRNCMALSSYTLVKSYKDNKVSQGSAWD
jgi:hypothetical protein